MFSNRSIIEVVTIYDNNTHAEISRLLMSFNLQNIAPQGSGYLKERTNAICDYLISNPQAKGPNGGNLQYEVLEYIIKERENSYSDWFELYKPSVIRALNQDGFDINNGTLTSYFPQQLNIALNTDEVDHLLTKHNFGTPKSHLEQAKQAHSRGDWAACNSQIRTFIEGLFDEIAYALGSTSNPTPTDTSHNRRVFLSRLTPPFFDSNLNEWDNSNNGGFVQGYWRRLHASGSHPGLSDKDDATFRMHMAIIVSHYYLKRFDSRQP